MNPSICTLIYSFHTVEDEQSWGTNNSKGRTGPENCAHKKARGLPLVCNRRFSVMRQTENKSCRSLREDFLSFFAPRAPRLSLTPRDPLHFHEKQQQTPSCWRTVVLLSPATKITVHKAPSHRFDACSSCVFVFHTHFKHLLLLLRFSQRNTETWTNFRYNESENRHGSRKLQSWKNWRISSDLIFYLRTKTDGLKKKQIQYLERIFFKTSRT